MRVKGLSLFPVHRPEAGIVLGMLALTGLIAQGLPDNDPELAYKLVKEKGALLLDVRTREEFEESHLSGARHLALQDLRQEIDQVRGWVRNRLDHPIVVYGHSGRRSERAKQILLREGFTQVTNLGPMSAWPEKP